MKLFFTQKISLVLIVLLFLPCVLKAQLTDDFSDGDFTNNPVWSGDVANWIVIGSELRSNGPAVTPTVLYLSTPSNLVTNCQWEFYANPKLATSSGNFMDVFLVSDQVNLNGNLNGYFVRIGGTPDEVSLYIKQGASSTRIIDGVDGIISSSSNNPTRVKVIRNSSDVWSLEVDVTGTGTSYVLQGTVTDATFLTGSYFGVLVNYSASNNLKYFFDNFYVAPIIIDINPPIVTSLNVISTTALDVLFNEGVSIASSEIFANYSANNGIGNPVTALRDLANPSLVHLTFSTPFSDGIYNTLTVTGVQDLAGNTMLTSNADFFYYQVRPYDVLFNELMADPVPAVGLPDNEYIELYNSTSFPISVNGWTLTHGTTNRTLPDVMIPADSFLVLVTTAALPFFAAYGNVTDVTGLSSSALINAGTTLVLRDNPGNIIHSIAYDDTWYQDEDKAGGGWSMEKINTLNLCGEKNNWKAAVHPNGGTPGSRNSVNASNPDNASSQLRGVCVISNTQIQLFFNEGIDSTTLLNLTAYSIDNGIGNPSGISITGPDYTSAILTLTNPFLPNRVYALTVANTISDCVGNPIASSDPVLFSIYDAAPFDIVINEIMADPDPPVGLPGYEYIELYNRTLFPINLNGWEITIGASTKTFPCSSIMPGSYLIIGDMNEAENFSGFGKVTGIENFPSLINTGTTITIRDSSGEIISIVSYSQEWYQNSNKEEGGWSLEQIDPGNPCAKMENWKASQNAAGGTPGTVNSVVAANPDVEAPQFLRVVVIDSINIKLYFDEPLNPNSILSASSYLIDNGIGNPINVSPIQPGFSSLLLSLASPLQHGIIYTITINSTITDCIGNIIGSDNSARFAIPEPVDVADIVINEILFNPKDDGVDFVELYNRSDKVIDLKELRLSSIDTITNQLTSVKVIDSLGYLLFPEDYLVLTTGADIVKKQYATANSKGFVNMSAMPSFNINAGTVVIAKVNEEIIDRFYYREEMHFPMLNELKGISLERLDFDRPGNDPGNWHSAAESVGFATPAYKNSQFNPAETANDPVTVQPRVFSPDNDGYDDVVNIGYRLNQPGYVANITILDANGRLVRYLVRNELLGVEGTVSWDGINETRERARIGIYIIFFEAFSLEGTIKKYKKTCVLAGRL